MLSDGVLTVIGLVTLLIVVSRTRLALAARPQIERLMPDFQISKGVPEGTNFDALFERKPRSADNVEEYVQTLRDLGVIKVGETFNLPLETISVTDTRPTKDASGNEVKDAQGNTVTEEYQYDQEILAGTLSDDPEAEDANGITVRMAKRRFNAAAKVLGFSLQWREPKGWLIGRASKSEVKVTAEAATSQGASNGPQESAQTTPATEAAPTNGGTQSVASAPSSTSTTGRRVVRRG